MNPKPLGLVVEEELDHLVGSLGGDVLLLIIRVLELLREVLDDEAGPLRLTEVESTGVVAVLDGVNPDEVDLALVLASNGLEHVDLLSVLLVGGVEEEVRERLAARSVDLVVIRADLVDDGDGEVTNPVFDVADERAANGVGVFDRGSSNERKTTIAGGVTPAASATSGSVERPKR